VSAPSKTTISISGKVRAAYAAQDQLALLVAKAVLDQLPKPAPVPVVKGWCGALIRRWQRRASTHATREVVISPYREQTQGNR